MQFSLRTLLLVVTVVAVVCSLTRWLHELGIAVSMLSLGVGFVGIGIWRRRKTQILGGCVLIVALVLWSPWLLTAACWVGHKKIPVTVCVQDQSRTAIPNATVQIDMSTASTNANGIAAVVAEFQICGTDTLFHKTGIIELLGEQLTVKAAGFKDFHGELAEQDPSRLLGLIRSDIARSSCPVGASPGASRQVITMRPEVFWIDRVGKGLRRHHAASPWRRLA